MPPTRSDGLKDSETTPRGNNVSVAVFVINVPHAALIWIGVDVVTGLVVIGNEPVLAPTGTVTC